MQINHDHHRADHITPTQAMAQAVIRRALLDAHHASPQSYGDGGTTRNQKSQADAWFRDCGRDFRDICDVAGIDARLLSEKYCAGKINVDILRVDRTNGD